MTIICACLMYIVPVSLFVVHIPTIVQCEIFYSSHDPVRLSLVHTSDISNENKAWLLLWDLRRQNNENFSLFCLLFCSWLMLGLWSYAYAYDDPYVAGLTSFLCFAFCFALMLMLSCEPGFNSIVIRNWSRLGLKMCIFLTLLTTSVNAKIWTE